MIPSVKDAVGSVAESYDAITTRNVLDVYRSLIKFVHLLRRASRPSDLLFRHFDTLSPSVISKLFDSVSSGLQAAVEASTHDLDSGDRTHEGLAAIRAPIEIFAFLLQWFSTAAERYSPKDGAEAIASAAKTKVCKSVAKFYGSITS